MDITLIEARELYRQGGLAKEVALRAFPEEEIVNDYTLMVALPTSVKRKESRTHFWALLCPRNRFSTTLL